jgi:probable rRNA maturation factor
MKVSLKNQQRSIYLNQQRIIRELRKALTLTGLQNAELSILFVNSRRMKLLNARYRGVNQVTDVLSFPQLSQEEIKDLRKRQAILKKPHIANVMPPSDILLGDIVICLPVASQQAKDLRVSFTAHLLRLMVHGLLHLLGYDHEINAYQKRKMEKKERELLHAVKTVG